MLVKDIIRLLNNYAPLSYSEEFDNTGLIIGNKNNNVTGILICLDSTVEVIQEAIDLKYNMIVSFHPIIFRGLKHLSLQRVRFQMFCHDTSGRSPTVLKR